MKDTQTRVFGLMCVLVGVWTAVYWLYEPGRPPVTFAQNSGTDSEGDGDSTGPMAAVTPPIGSQRPRPATLPQASRSTAPPPSATLPQSGPASVPIQRPSKPPVQTSVVTPPPATRVVAPEYWEYTVQQGDGSMEAIARRLLGEGRLWVKIAEANPLLDARKLIPGRTVLKIPRDITNIQGKEVPTGGGSEPASTAGTSPSSGAPEPLADKKTAAGERTYVVKAGDTLSEIAKAMYGKSAMWRRIYEANENVIDDPDAVKPGTTLRIPSGG